MRITDSAADAHQPGRSAGPADCSEDAASCWRFRLALAADPALPADLADPAGIAHSAAAESAGPAGGRRAVCSWSGYSAGLPAVADSAAPAEPGLAAELLLFSLYELLLAAADPAAVPAPLWAAAAGQLRIQPLS